jgi:hypothetical protein
VSPEPYRQPVAWMARLRTRAVQRAAFLVFCAIGIAAFCAATFREEYFWILLMAVPTAIGASIGLVRTWRTLGMSFDLTWRVVPGGVEYTYAGANYALSFAQIERVEIRPAVVVLHFSPDGKNFIAAGSPGFQAFCAALRLECEQAGVGVSHRELREGVKAGVIRIIPWLVVLMFRPRRMKLLIAGAVATVLCVYYLAVFAWPSIPVGLGLGIAAAWSLGALARAKMRPLAAKVAT